MKLKDAYRQIDCFIKALATIHPELSCNKIKSRGGPFKKWFRDEVPADGYCKKSGVYIFSNLDSDILYIGKAAANNLGAEIYGKFGAASAFNEQNEPYFENSPMVEWAQGKCRDYLLNGDVYISAISIEPKDFTSLFEVYLQAWCAIEEKLPPLNRRIG